MTSFKTETKVKTIYKKEILLSQITLFFSKFNIHKSPIELLETLTCVPIHLSHINKKFAFQQRLSDHSKLFSKNDYVNPLVLNIAYRYVKT